MSISSLHDRFQSINSQQNLKGNIKYISYPRQTNRKHQNLLKLYNSQLSTTNCVTSCEIHKIKHEMRISNTGTFFSERETCIELHYRILHQHIYTEIKGRPFCRQYLNMHFLQRLLLCFLLNVIEIRALFSYWLHVCIAFRQVKNWTKTINCFTIQFQRVEKSKWFSTFTLPCLNAIMKSGLSQVCR